ncbi:MAG: Nramp family divalent metal transporter, partial [Saprospiraceae bacterium]|nr:Nramp family divalent metal transporter [Saprospiraceae bacterium]
MGIWQKIRSIGPGAMVAAAFIGPGTVTTATIAGASYGYTLLWAILFSILATLLLQEMSARLGLIGGMGVGASIRNKLHGKLGFIFAAILVIGAILIGNAAYEAGNITGAVLGFERIAARYGHWPVNPLVLIIGIVAFLLLFSGAFRLIERSLVLMVSVMGVVFLVSAILLQPDVGQILRHMFVPE